MAYITGTCTGHLALLAALQTFLESVGWTTKRSTTGSEYEYIAMGPGISGADAIYIGIKSYTDAANQYYNWRLRGYTGYSSGLSFDSQPGSISHTAPSMPSLLLTNGTIQYWFIADTRRVIIVAKCGTSYECAYLGLILPYAPTSQLPYPLCIGGSHIAYTIAYTDQSYNHFAFWNPQSNVGGTCPAWMLCGASWVGILNRYSNNVCMDRLNIWPYSGYPASEESPSTGSLEFWQVRENIDGSYPLLPLIIHSGSSLTTKALYGELSGIYAIPKWEELAEDTLTIGSDTYLVVQSAFRTTNRAYAAIKLA